MKNQLEIIPEGPLAGVWLWLFYPAGPAVWISGEVPQGGPSRV